VGILKFASVAPVGHTVSTDSDDVLVSGANGCGVGAKRGRLLRYYFIGRRGGGGVGYKMETCLLVAVETCPLMRDEKLAFASAMAGQRPLARIVDLFDLD
jgi:hypothetical protein